MTAPAAASAQALAPPSAVAADPLQAYQASLIVGLGTTLAKLRKLRQDRMKILAIPAPEQGRPREDGQAWRPGRRPVVR